MTEKHLARGALIIYMLLVYAFYPTFHLAFSKVPHSLYQRLTESFLSGHLHLLVPPAPQLMQLTNPYDPSLNVHFKLHDASLYKGNYYLYFGPLPVLAFYLPVKLLTGFYPSDGLAAFFFVSLGFLVNFYLIVKIKEAYFSQVPELQLVLFGLMLGFTNGILFLMSRPLVYEVAIASAYCLMSFALFFLYQIVTNQNRSTARRRELCLFSLCLSLSVAGRPQFALLCCFLLPVLCLYLSKQPHTKNQQLIEAIALFIPAMTVGIILGLYNYLRFGSIWDFGHIWQLSCNNIQALHAELVDLSKIPRNLFYGFYFYFLQPFTTGPTFPYLGLSWHNCRYHIDQDYYLEAVAGVLTTTPFILLILVLPKLIRLYFKEKSHLPLVWFSLITAFVPLINALFLMFLPFAIQRYEVDFLPYFILLSIITLWLYENYAPHSRWFKLVKILFITTGIFSIYIGLSLGLAYWLLV